MKMKTAWMDVGKAQKDIPVHVANEYCRADRSFHPRPEFNEETLPEDLTFCSEDNETDELWFPMSDPPGLGLKFAIGRGYGQKCASASIAVGDGKDDLEAIKHLDRVREDDLAQSRRNLMPSGEESMQAMANRPI